MKSKKIIFSAGAAFMAMGIFGTPVWAAATVQIGASGKTYASSMVQCAANPTTGVQSPVVEAGLFNPKQGTTATVSLNGTSVATITASDPPVQVWLAEGSNSVRIALSKRTVDSYTFTVQPGICALPDTSGNTFNADGTLEYAAKSYATVTPGCALNPVTGLPQPYVHLFANGDYMLNVSVNGVPLTQLSASRPHTPVFLSIGQNVISAANGSLSTDYYVRDGGDGACTLP
jgi:streptogramin lyase